MTTQLKPPEFFCLVTKAEFKKLFVTKLWGGALWTPGT